MGDSVVLPAKDDVPRETVGGPGDESTVNGINQPSDDGKGDGSKFGSFGWSIKLSPPAQRAVMQTSI